MEIEQCQPTCRMPLSSVGRCPTPHHIQDGDTALVSAARGEKWDTVRLLVERKADPNISALVRLIIAFLQLTLTHNP